MSTVGEKSTTGIQPNVAGCLLCAHMVDRNYIRSDRKRKISSFASTLFNP